MYFFLLCRRAKLSRGFIVPYIWKLIDHPSCERFFFFWRFLQESGQSPPSNNNNNNNGAFCILELVGINRHINIRPRLKARIPILSLEVWVGTCTCTPLIDITEEFQSIDYNVVSGLIGLTLTHAFVGLGRRANLLLVSRAFLDPPRKQGRYSLFVNPGLMWESLSRTGAAAAVILPTRKTPNIFHGRNPKELFVVCFLKNMSQGTYFLFGHNTVDLINCSLFFTWK